MIKNIKNVKGKTLGTFNLSFNDFDGKYGYYKIYVTCDKEKADSLKAFFREVKPFILNDNSSFNDLDPKTTTQEIGLPLDEIKIQAFKKELKEEAQGNIDEFLSYVTKFGVTSFRVADIKTSLTEESKYTISVYLKGFENFEKDINDFVLASKKDERFKSGFVGRNGTKNIDFNINFNGGIACKMFLERYRPAAIPEYRINELIENAKGTDTMGISIVDLFKFYEGYYNKPHKDAGISKNLIIQLNDRLIQANKEKEEKERQIEALKAQIAALQAK